MTRVTQVGSQTLTTQENAYLTYDVALALGPTPQSFKLILTIPPKFIGQAMEYTIDVGIRFMAVR